MTRPLAWITAAVLGAAATFVLSFGVLELIAFAALAIAVGVVGGRATWLAGFLTGFGGMWQLGALSWVLSGWPGDAIPDVVIFVGLVPLALGLASSVALAARARSPSG